MFQGMSLADHFQLSNHWSSFICPVDNTFILKMAAYVDFKCFEQLFGIKVGTTARISLGFDK